MRVTHLIVFILGISSAHAQCYTLIDFRECDTGFESIAISPDQKYMISGHLDGTIRSWDLKTLTVIQSMDFHTGQVNNLLFTHQGTKVVSAAADNKIVIWDVPSLYMNRSFDTPVEELSFAAMDQHDSLIYYGGNNTIASNDYSYGFDNIPYGALMRVSVKSKISEVFYHYDGNTFNITDGNISYESQKLYFAQEKDLFIYNLVDDSMERVPTPYYLNNLTVSNHTIYAWGEERLIRFRKSNGKYSLREVPATFVGIPDKSAYSRIAISKNLNMLVTGSSQDECILWNADDMTVQQVLFGHSQLVRAFQFYNNDQYLLTAGYDGRLLLWERKPDLTDCDQNMDFPLVFTYFRTPIKIYDKKIIQKEQDVNNTRLSLKFKASTADTIALYLNRECIYLGPSDRWIERQISISEGNEENNLVFYSRSNFTDEVKKLSLKMKDGNEEKALVLKSTISDTEALKFIINKK